MTGSHNIHLLINTVKNALVIQIHNRRSNSTGYFIDKPTWCSFKQSRLFFTAISFYMFRVLSAPIIRSTIKTVDTVIGTVHVSMWCDLNPLKGVQGRESIAQCHLE
jgi:hypothetical protein